MTDSGSPEREVPEFGLVADEELPEDLQPAQNPLARDPDEDRSDQPGDGRMAEASAAEDRAEPSPPG